jgi:hypothetical protein
LRRVSALLIGSTKKPLFAPATASVMCRFIKSYKSVGGKARLRPENRRFHAHGTGAKHFAGTTDFLLVREFLNTSKNSRVTFRAI